MRGLVFILLGLGLCGATLIGLRLRDLIGARPFATLGGAVLGAAVVAACGGHGHG